VDLWGEIGLLHTLERFFDRAVYFAAIGYESAGEHAATAQVGWKTRVAGVR